MATTKTFPVRENREFGKTQEIWFAQVVNFLIIKVKIVSIFAAKFPFFDAVGLYAYSPEGM